MPAILPGRFAWHELMTTDPDAAKAFYGAVVGWGSMAWGEDQSYTLWLKGEMPVGGLMALPDEVKAAGIPPHWLTYISVPDTDASAAQATQLGGKVLKPPFSVPSVGRMAVLSDPQGAVFLLYTSEHEMGPDAMPEVGEFSWHELATTDIEGAVRFYSAMFGWEKRDAIDMGPAGPYQMYGLPGSPMPIGGIYTKPAEVPVCNWLPYAMVKSADDSVATATARGGKVIHGPMEVPGGDRVAVMIDPQGAVFAVHSRAG